MSDSRAFFRQLRADVVASGRAAAKTAAGDAVGHARETDASGRHHGGWRDDSKDLSNSIRAVRDRAQSTPARHRYAISALATNGRGETYAVYLERLGYWVVTGLGLYARAAFRHAMRRELRDRRSLK